MITVITNEALYLYISKDHYRLIVFQNYLIQISYIYVLNNLKMNLLEGTVNELMKKFGAGNHKPGSGSAAAFQCMVSVKLISTVISLTLEKPQYAQYSTELLDFQDQLENRIYPRLANLFQIDSEQFDKTIQLRKARDQERDEPTQNQLRRQALEELKESIATPFEIASLCIEVAEIGSYIFDNGFKSARGDSQVGISGAVSALAGCMAIIRLNVLSFNVSEYEYCKSVITKINSIDKIYQNLVITADQKIKILQIEFENKLPLFEGLNNIRKKYKGKKNINIEECVRDLQNLIWNQRALVWKKNTPTSYHAILKPDPIIKLLGYDFFNSSNYAIPSENGDTIIKVAGIIDQANKLVAVSNEFSPEIQRFTAAHELGHALLHNHTILHRDLPDSIINSGATDYIEIQANKFAAYFLMPATLVKDEFWKIYSSSTFKINEETAFNFTGQSTIDLRKKCKNLRELSRMLASAKSYNNKHFKPLANQFNVSIETMAIRLEELKLVEY